MQTKTMTADVQQARQGDVLIERIEALPPGLKATKERILAHGEAHGHGHVVTGDCTVYATNQPDIFYVEVPEGDVEATVAIQHLMVASGVWTGEHFPIAIEPGIYKVSGQFEYDPYEQAIQRVID